MILLVSGLSQTEMVRSEESTQFVMSGKKEWKSGTLHLWQRLSTSFGEGEGSSSLHIAVLLFQGLTTSNHWLDIVILIGLGNISLLLDWYSTKLH